MRPPKNSWPNTTDARGVLMFAQLASEMLTPTSFESFRVYSLDSIARLREALRVIDDVKFDRLPRQALIPIFEEVVWSLEKDPIATRFAGREIYSFDLLTQNKNTSLNLLAANIKLISRLIGGDYKKSLEERILSLSSKSKERIEFRQVTGFYVSHLLNIGYSRSFILDLINDTFFGANLTTADESILRRFFLNFDGQRRKFTVFVPISLDFGGFVRRLGFDVFKRKKVPKEVFDALDSASNVHLDMVFQRSVDELDNYKALDSTHKLLTSLRALTFLAPDGMPCSWSAEMFVIDSRGDAGVLLSRGVGPFSQLATGRLTAGRRLKGMKNYSMRILENFDRPSTSRLLNSITTAALSRSTPNIENQLISLWSSVEVLLSEPEKSVPRIVHYCERLLPCICLRHVRRQFVAVHDELLVAYRGRFNRIVGEEQGVSKSDSHTAFANVLCLTENKHLQDRLLSLCTDNPLALHRMWKLHRDYGVPGNAIAAVKSHEKRVAWQIHRIYRARNNLVHSGKMPSYLESLLLNASEYFRSSVATIVHRARKEKHRSEIDQVVQEIGIEYEIFKGVLREHEASSEFSRGEFARLIL